MRQRFTLLILLALIISVKGVAAQEPASGQTPPSTSQPSIVQARPVTDLFLARSLGGSRYTSGDSIFVPDASSPELVRLPKGGLLALFDRRFSGKGKTALLATRSSDEGRTWTRARPIRMTGSDGKSNKSPGARHADVLRLPNGTLRMYFTQSAPDGACAIRSATSVDGLNYKMDDIVAATLEKCSDARPGVVRAGGRIQLFVCRVETGESTKPAAKNSPEVLHFTSRDGRKFEPVGRVNLAGGIPGSGFTAHAKGMRAVVALDDKLRSVVSRDGKDWTLESTVLLASGRNASIVEMRDGTYLMAYENSSKPSAGSNQRHALVTLAPRIKNENAKGETVESESHLVDAAADDAGDAGSAATEIGWEVFADDSAPPVDAPLPDSTQSPESPNAAPVNEDGALSLESTSSTANAESANAPAEPVIDEKAKAEAERLAKEREDWLAVPDAVRPQIDTLPPLPDFTTPVNYAEWYARLCDMNTPDNAYWAYDEFMPSPLNIDRQKEWPAFDIMYNRADFTEPAPWDPAKLPEWEASYQASKSLLEKFEAATQHTGFARPVQFRPDDAAESPTGQPLLVGLLLPDLSAHRSLVKQTLGANWRIDESGKPNADKMMEGWRTALSSASHMHQGATLIEQLVGTSEQSLVQSDARQALKQGVFKGKQLEEALALLEHNDHDDFDVNRSMQGEHAFVFDLMQAMFKSDKPGDPPRPLPEAIDKIVPLVGEDSKVIPEIKKMTPADVKKTLNAFETYYNEASSALGTGYPQVRASDLDQMAQKHIKVSPLTHALLPAFGRIQKTRARNEASRRATQLSYAVHIYKEQNGRWPQSLSELPDRFSTTMRTDPFTGGQFGYRVDENGPVIYSLSENGKDDGGRHSTRWDDEKNGDSDDYVFWPVQPK